ncbi:interferon gamma receptor 2 [Dasypus novemcinctus]|uniref:interferon gamma receptor 2 n=1 Tax=Dasypus novemcinctus TaxID=9361 RepID=UPI00032921C4|nr:interferon gamma receptor 2 [Dasypus novemcinctus]
MRPGPPLLSPLLLLLLLGGRSAGASPPDPPAQLPAPQRPKLHLYNAKQRLSWEPVSLGNGTRPVLYHVQYKYTSSEWYDIDLKGVNCTKITETQCDFTANLSEGFTPYFNITLRLRAELGELVSAWVVVPWFQHYRNVTIGPPENISVTPGEGSLIIMFSSPFDVATSMVTLEYYIHYWEKEGIQEVKGPFIGNSIVLGGLRPLREYCLQVRAELIWPRQNICRPGQLSNTSCCETAANASAKLQQAIPIFAGTFLVVLALAGACYFLMLRYRGLIKYWFHSPPRIPSQIEEYLRNPDQPILEALSKDSSPEEDAYDSLSIVAFPEGEREDVPQSTGLGSPHPRRGH